MPSPTFSLIVPTRGRPAQLRAFLESVATTTARPGKLEVVLVIDADDPASQVNHPRLQVRHVVVPPGLSMGALNVAGDSAASGDYRMLLNDDVIVQTSGWDSIARKCLRRFPDPYVLIHVNDTLMGTNLCTFPLVSRQFCDLAGGICPVEYRRYRIDDHIEDIFNILTFLGYRRTVYLPDVVFEHTNAIDHPTAGRVYQSDPVILAQDAPKFDELFPVRKELALRVLEAMGGDISGARTKLEMIPDSFALRTVGRQQMIRAAWWRRVRYCMQTKGCGGLARAVGRRVLAAS